MTAFFGVVIGIGWAFSYILDAQGILYIAIIFALVMNVGAYWYSDKLVIATAGAHEADNVQFLELHRVVEKLGDHGRATETARIYYFRSITECVCNRP